MKTISISILVLLALLPSGCSKKDAATLSQKAEAAAPLPPEEALKIEAQFVPPPKQASAATIEERLNGAVHPGLTAVLQAFVATHGRMPESIYELSNSGVDSIPALPLTMKFVIDPADKTVKVVRK
jgi:hypothetical protein